MDAILNLFVLYVFSTPVLCETYFVIYKLFISYVTPISMLFYHYKGVYFRAIQLYVKTMQTIFQTYADATF